MEHVLDVRKPRLSRASAVRLAPLALLSALLVGSTVGCGDSSPSQSPSLESPSAMAMAKRSKCGTASVLGGFNDTNRNCTIGLVTNAGSDSLAVMDLGLRRPSFADLDSGIPTATHIPVGDRPVDVAVNATGTAAYTLNSVSNDLSVVDLWRLERQSTLSLPHSARAIAAGPGTERGGQLVVALTEPNELWIRRGIHCNSPSSNNSGCNAPNVQPVTRTLPGRPAEVAVGPAGGRAYVVYQNRRYMSVVALDNGTPIVDRGLACRGARTSAPCEVRRVGLTWGCSDGVDNDGDGRTDQADPQCWAPDGAESPDGIGKTPRTACNDGVDNDNDGKLDRNDPDCQAAADRSEEEPLNPDARFACSNGVDDDGDGQTDYPADESCYGAHGATESTIERTGFESVTVDRMGELVYVLDRANSQLLAVDAERLELLDTRRAPSPTSAPFDTTIGVSVGDRPSAAVGVVGRNVQWRDPNDGSHGIVRYSLGAYVASDNGSTYFVEALNTQCEVREPNREKLLSDSQFRLDSNAFQKSAERHCMTLPELPLEKTDSSGNLVDACEQSRACIRCTRRNSFDSCTAKCEDFSRNRVECRAAGRDFLPSMQTRLTVNPTFEIVDAQPRAGQIIGRGQCMAPEDFGTALREYARENPEDAPQNFRCDSPLRPQPLSPAADQSALESDTLEDVSPAQLLRDVTLHLQPESSGNGVETTIRTRRWDRRYIGERWSVTWEATLPNTDRKDGLLARQTRQISEGGDTTRVVNLDPGGVDPCSMGVRSGDRLTVKTKPKSGEGAPNRCSNFVPPNDRGGGANGPTPDNRDPYRTYRVRSVRPDRIVLETFDSGAQTLDFADTLPTRQCFPKAISYEIRAEDEWVVRGSESGFISSRTSELNRCVRRYTGGAETFGGRVETGGLHLGPYLSLFVFPGDVQPIRRPNTEYRYEFTVRRFYQPSSFNSNVTLPSDALITPNSNGGMKLLVSDVSGDFVWIHNFSNQVNNPRSFRRR